MRSLIILIALAAGTNAAKAQDKLYRCGNEYTNTVSEAQARNCKLVSDGVPKPVPKASVQAAKRYRGSVQSGAYEVEMSHNDEIFLINGEKFSAKTYCFGMEKGDLVKFVSGSPYGACATAVLFNVRTTDTCEVWCD